MAGLLLRDNVERIDRALLWQVPHGPCIWCLLVCVYVYCTAVCSK
jgi:hypothetical protein